MRKTFGKAFLTSLLTISLAAGVANAQNTMPSAENNTTQAKKLAAAPPKKPDLEPKAIELLKAVSERLAAAHTLSFTAVQMFESPSRQGPPLAYAKKTEVTVQRPDRMRVIISGDGPASEFYYNGKTVTAFAPGQNLVAVSDAPPTIDAMLEAVYRSSGIFFTFTDLVVANPYKDMAEGSTLAYYVGQSHVVAGTTTDIVAYIDNGVFIQMWIGSEDKLPRMVRAIFLNDPNHLRSQVEFSDWQLDRTVPADTFAPPNAASNAKRIPFANIKTQAAAGTMPSARPNSPQRQP